MSMTLSTSLLALSTTGVAVAAIVGRRPRRFLVGGLLLFAASCTAVMLGERWLRLGQGPFISLYEILASSLFSLSLVYGIVYLYRPSVRTGAPIAAAILTLIGIWALASDPGHLPLPATYGNPWLWVHVLFGKLFLACSLVAAGLAARLLLRRGSGHGDATQERLVDAWRWLALALVTHTAMLVSGAIWAQDAWGRYWGWDPLETWAFATWIGMVFAFHARVSLDLSEAAQQWLIVGVFVLAFLTFFGIPFVSTAPHKGAI